MKEEIKKAAEIVTGLGRPAANEVVVRRRTPRLTKMIWAMMVTGGRYREPMVAAV